jgi:hypothetical protein
MQWSPFLGLNHAKQLGQWKTRLTLSLEIFSPTFLLQLGQVTTQSPTMPFQTGITLFVLANARPAKPNKLTKLTAIQVVFRNSRRLLFINSPYRLVG